MSIKVALEHRSSYDFDRAVTLSPHVVRLRPSPAGRTPIESYSLQVSPPDHFVNWQQDPFGNWLARLVFPEPVRRLEITVGLVADLAVVNPLDFFVEDYAQDFPFSYESRVAEDLAPYLRPIDCGWDPAVPVDGVSTVAFLASLNQAVFDAVAYEVRMETGVQTPDETLSRGIGSCRDSAWLLVALLRRHGLAARFVSGYLVQLAADPLPGETAPEGPADGQHSDVSDLHAWAEVFVPGAGWIGLDPTSALFAGEGHLALAAVPHFAAAVPIEGTTEPVGVRFGFHHDLRRIQEDPRVTAPYTPEQWARVDALGQDVDARLEAGDVRLTMGGEPTFVSAEDATTPQWNVAADGEEKRALADALAERLRVAFAHGGAVQRGQGKWYPGEPLPRWQIALQWRTDGQTLWSDPGLLADPWQEKAAVEEAPALARRLAEELTALLGLPEAQLIPAYDDPLLPLAAELARPDGDPPGTDPAAPGSGSRTALVAALDAELEPVAWVLPLVTDEEGWRSPVWSFRRGRLVLGPGSSPAGLRLPLDAVSWTLPAATGEPSYLRAGPPLEADLPSVEVVGPDEQPTTALGVEARDGFVHVFVPPADRLEDYAALLRLVERAAGRVGHPVVLEGYGPPPDARLTQLVVTPDPGVVEVNVQPTASWAEQRALTERLYEEAHLAGLTTEKFDLDGLHTGTGGGNHLTLGGAEPADSPVLCRPDLLASLVRYWQRHPSLSYLFSGRFIGPTSQAPRFDEGRPEAVYEMEIALAEVARLTGDLADEDGETRPWLVDRAMRHLLTDLVGNTHRSEFCIDKLYSPDSSRGRLGLLELRGFEMPPHPQMALVQALLVRSLVAMFWETPCTDPLVRWGTALHEDFLLPEGVGRDIAEVAADLREHGIAFEETWLDPFTEFRFPRIGVTRAGGVELELRAAIEPWHVLGEEAAAGGTARYVDSSLQRLQVTARGFDPHRHVVTCQGVPVPLTPTGRSRESYAGVRYRAWQPWSALHPSIGVHAPLHFDVVDLAAGVSRGGATYHVVHPGGRSYDHRPVNAGEAEARRSARFEVTGHTAGAVDVAAVLERGRRAASDDYPHTLDLRRT